MMNQKIFGIGLSKTGTTSLTRALQILGYTAIHCPRELGMVRFHDAATDTPIARHYKTLDQMYPGSKFILTVRDFDSWMESCSKFFRNRKQIPNNEFRDEVNQFLYGGREFDTARFTAAISNHLQGVEKYFKDRPKDLLVLNICGGNGWNRLCKFLNKEVPNKPFPWANKTTKRK